MPTKAPPPPARSQKPPSSVDPTLPVARVVTNPAAAAVVVTRESPEAVNVDIVDVRKPKIRIRTRYGYPIHIPHLQRLIRPEETVELDDHDWIRKQIGYGTFILLED